MSTHPAFVVAPGESDTAAGNALALVGSWRLESAHEPDGEVLILNGDGSLLLFRRCGLMQGAWDADDAGLFAAATAGGDMSCHTTNVGWLRDLGGYRAHGHDQLLLNRDGTTAATLLPGGHATASSGDAASLTVVTPVTPAQRALLSESVRPVGSSRPPTPRELASGHWVAEVSRAGTPARDLTTATFGPGMTVTAGGRCGGFDGVYSLSPGGNIVTAPDADESDVGEVGCPTPALGDQIPHAVTAALSPSGNFLSLYDPAGVLLTTLIHTTR